jgi:hypothetical protein
MDLIFLNGTNINDQSVDMDAFSNTHNIVILSILSICCLFGLYGNIVSTLIFMHPIMRSPIDVLLTGLSMIDLFLITFAIPVHVVLPALVNVFDAPNEAFTAFATFVLYPLSMTTQTCSIWLFSVISIERYLAICQPLKVSHAF